MNDFVEFPKIARLSREVIVTEKIDGTNAQVFICGDDEDGIDYSGVVAEAGGLAIFAGSRNRWLTVKEDNFGFARWVQDHAAELAGLGIGRHFGEWWGSGIQRRYGLTGNDKRFSLFNVARWADERPACCHAVPVLYRGMFDTQAVEGCIDLLRSHGSVAAPGFMNPEGVIVFHIAGNVGFKKTLHKDELPKALAA
jgi:hypothetical protein